VSETIPDAPGCVGSHSRCTRDSLDHFRLPRIRIPALSDPFRSIPTISGVFRLDFGIQWQSAQAQENNKEYATITKPLTKINITSNNAKTHENTKA